MYTKTFEVRWDDVDPNQHLRHTSYGTYAAQARISLFLDHGIEFGADGMDGIAPILFREELVYRREIGLNQLITVQTEVSVLSPNAGRWSMHHEVIRPDGLLAATVDVDGAWIDLSSRKLAVPGPRIANLMGSLRPGMPGLPVS